jgi:probable rRNA maturation factor
MKNVSSTLIINKTKGTPTPVGVPFESIKDRILGIKYELSVSFVSAHTQRKINRTYRSKDKTTNILSFPLSEESGEITFDLAKVRKDAPEFDMPYTQFLKYLFIHGCLHLKGFEHSSTMDKEEKKFLKIFS